MRKDRFFIWIPFGLSSDKPSDCFRFCSRFHCLLLPCRSEGTPLQNIELLDASQTCKKLASHMLEYELVYLMLKLTFLCSNPIGHFISHDLCSKRCGVWSSLKLCLKVVWSKNVFRCSTSKSWLGGFWNQPYTYTYIYIYIYIYPPAPALQGHQAAGVGNSPLITDWQIILSQITCYWSLLCLLTADQWLL